MIIVNLSLQHRTMVDFFRIIEYLSTVFKIIDYKDVNKSRFNKDSKRGV